MKIVMKPFINTDAAARAPWQARCLKDFGQRGQSSARLPLQRVKFDEQKQLQENWVQITKVYLGPRA